MRTVHRNDTAEAVKSPEIGRHRAIALR